MSENNEMTSFNASNHHGYIKASHCPYGACSSTCLISLWKLMGLRLKPVLNHMNDRSNKSIPFNSKPGHTHKCVEVNQVLVGINKNPGFL